MTNFEQRLAELGFATYDAYLRSEHWSDFKRRYRNQNRNAGCAVCGDADVELHHHTYVRLGAERIDDVTPLCGAHHTAVHAWLVSSGLVFVEFTHRAIAHFKPRDVPAVERVADPPRAPKPISVCSCGAHKKRGRPKCGGCDPHKVRMLRAPKPPPPKCPLCGRSRKPKWVLCEPCVHAGRTI